jgi:hypothetical protein
MPSHVTSLIAEVEKARTALNRVTNPQLHSAKARASLRAIVERYFNEVRPSIGETSTAAQHIDGVDTAMQALLALCHKKGSVQKYRELLREAKGHLVHLDSGIVARAGGQSSNDRTEQDVRIVTTLRALLPSAALSYEQALLDLSAGERLSWRGPATDLREALRETLDHLAPDKDVQESAGYKQESNASGPTMKQKVRYILRNRGQSKAKAATTEDATAAIDEALGTFVRSVYTRSSVSTHTPTDRGEVMRLRDLVRVVFGELLEAR